MIIINKKNTDYVFHKDEETSLKFIEFLVSKNKNESFLIVSSDLKNIFVLNNFTNCTVIEENYFYTHLAVGINYSNFVFLSHEHCKEFIANCEEKNTNFHTYVIEVK